MYRPRRNYALFCIFFIIINTEFLDASFRYRGLNCDARLAGKTYVGVRQSGECGLFEYGKNDDLFRPSRGHPSDARIVYIYDKEGDYKTRAVSFISRDFENVG